MCALELAGILLCYFIMRIAISHQQGRISPVFDVAARILLVDIHNGRTVRRNERALVQMDSLARARQVSQFGVELLICGAISWPLENALSSMGVQVAACICGPVNEVIKAYVNDKLGDPAFIMPGCLDRQQRLTTKKEGSVNKHNINYDTLVRITKAISTIQDPEEIVLITVEGVTPRAQRQGVCPVSVPVKKAMNSSWPVITGLSDEYVDKGPVSAIHSIASSLQDRQPVAIFDVSDDPRIQYPEAAIREGIASILSSPIIIGDRLLGCLRVYTAEPWGGFTLSDVNFVQAVVPVGRHGNRDVPGQPGVAGKYRCPGNDAGFDCCPANCPMT